MSISTDVLEQPDLGMSKLESADSHGYAERCAALKQSSIESIWGTAATGSTTNGGFRIQEQAFGGMNPDLRRRLLRLGESQSVFGKRRGNEVLLMLWA